MWSFCIRSPCHRNYDISLLHGGSGVFNRIWPLPFRFQDPLEFGCSFHRSLTLVGGVDHGQGTPKTTAWARSSRFECTLEFPRFQWGRLSRQITSFLLPIPPIIIIILIDRFFKSQGIRTTFISFNVKWETLAAEDPWVTKIFPLFLPFVFCTGSSSY